MQRRAVQIHQPAGHSRQLSAVDCPGGGVHRAPGQVGACGCTQVVGQQTSKQMKRWAVQVAASTGRQRRPGPVSSHASGSRRVSTWW